MTEGPHTIFPSYLPWVLLGAVVVAAILIVGSCELLERIF